MGFYKRTPLRKYKRIKKLCTACGSFNMGIGRERDDEGVPFEQTHCFNCGDEVLVRWLG